MNRRMVRDVAAWIQLLAQLASLSVVLVQANQLCS